MNQGYRGDLGHPIVRNEYDSNLGRQLEAEDHDSSSDEERPNNYSPNDVRLLVQDFSSQPNQYPGIELSSQTRGNTTHATSMMQSMTSDYNSTYSTPVVPEQDGKKILRKVSEFYGFIMIIYVLGILSLSHVISFYCPLLFVTVLSVIQTVRVVKTLKNNTNITARQQRGKYSKALDWALISSICVCGVLSVPIQLSNLVYIAFINIVFAYTFCDVQTSLMKKSTLTLCKVFFWTQILLITLKVDGLLDNWAFVFVGLFYTLVFFMSVSVGFFILAFSYVCQTYSLEGFDNNMLGLVWDFLNALFSWIWGFALLGVIGELKENDNTSVLIPSLIAGLIHGTVLSIYTYSLREDLDVYLTLTVQLLNRGDEEDTVGFQNDYARPIKHTFEKIKEKMPYLLKISPTYFMVANQDFKLKDKDEAKGYRKQMREVKKQRKHTKIITKNTEAIMELITKAKPEYKSATIKLQTRPSRGRKYDANQVATSPFGLSPGLTPGLSSGLKLGNNQNLCYSEDDADYLGEVQSKVTQNQDNEDAEQSCVICYINRPNAVFMGCGHGGACYSCALETWKSGDKCIMCRQPIEEILKVTVVNGVNVAKVIEGTRKFSTIDEEEFDN